MKTPTARKLPSGSWFVRVQVNGEIVSITKPTEKEAIAEAMAIKAGNKFPESAAKEKTVEQAITDYIKARKDVLSLATVRGYNTIKDNRFKSTMRMKITTISPEKWQTIVNAEARRCSAKTLKNAWGFMSSVIRETTGRTVQVQLPQVIPNEREFLDSDQIKTFLNEVQGTDVEIAALLALSSLRRSEIAALMWEDVDLEKGRIHVQGATVPDENHKLIRKQETKNASSRRDVPIIKPLMDALTAAEQKTGLVVKMHPATVYRKINEVCEAADLPKVGVHGLRHCFASLAYSLNIPEKITMEIGGWSDEATMRKIYTHIANKQRDDYGKDYLAFFDPNCNKTVTEK